MAQQVKNPPAMQETQVRSLGQEDPLEEEMATHFSVLAWKISWIEELVATVQRVTELDTTEQLSACAHTHTHTHYKYVLLKL